MSIVGKRYASSQMQNIWSAETKILKERELWIAVMRAQAKLSLDISSEVIAAYESVKTKIDLSSIERREAELKHDVKARIEEFNALAGHQAIHVGLTSRDITENVEAWQIKKSLELTLASSTLLLQELIAKIEKYAELPIVGRTHNVPAQLTTLGKRFASWSEEFLSAIDNLETLNSNFPLKGVKGAIGTGSDLQSILGDNWAEVEVGIEELFGIRHLLVAPSQIYPRSIDFQVVSSLFQLASPIATAAINIRLMAGLGLVSECQSVHQVGSSAMPHKNNPRLSERISGLFVLLKGYMTMVTEISGAQWNEGDVSESVVRRIALPDAFYTIDSIIRTSIKVFQELKVDEIAIDKELNEELEFLLSGKVMMLAFNKGVGREIAHNTILNCATEAKEVGLHNFFQLLAKSQELKISIEELMELKKDIKHHLGNAPRQSREILELARVRIKRMSSTSDLKLDPISN